MRIVRPFAESRRHTASRSGSLRGARETDQRLFDIASARSFADLDRVTRDPYFDFTAPTDSRPFFFNMLKPRGFFYSEGPASGGVVSGNLRATRTLLALAVIAGVLVLAIIGWPLIGTRAARRCPTRALRRPRYLLRDHWLCVHADPDRVPAAVFRLPGSPDVYVLDHPLPHDPGRRPWQPRVRGD